jgi:hypothetical protein
MRRPEGRFERCFETAGKGAVTRWERRPSVISSHVVLPRSTERGYRLTPDFDASGKPSTPDYHVLQRRWLEGVEVALERRSAGPRLRSHLTPW